MGAVLLVARLTPLEQRTQAAALGILVAFVLGGVALIVTRPQPAVLMRLADLRLGLKERLSTAWERRTEAGPLDDVLRRDALQHASRARLAAAFPVRVQWGEASLIAVLAIACLALAFVPNRMDQVLRQRQADRASQARAANTVRDTQKKVADLPKPAPIDPQVARILRDLEAKIRRADSPRTALESITPAEQQLQQLSDPQTPARSSSAQNLANALSATSAGRNAAQALSRSPSKGAQSLRDLAAQLQNLSPKDRDELAKALARAAQQARDGKMGDSLKKASDALQSGDAASASSALNDLASQLDSLQQQQNNDQAVASAINALESARQELAGQADRDAGQSAQPGASPGASRGAGTGASPGTSGSGSGTGGSPGASGSGNGTGTGSGNGTGNGGNGSGSGSGTGTGSGSGGSGGTGGTGSSGSGAGSGTGAPSTERIYMPGQPVPGQSENDPAPLGPGQDVPLSPYSQVIQAYQQAALDAANQSLIPGSERDLIREYFSQLGEARGVS